MHRAYRLTQLLTMAITAIALAAPAVVAEPPAEENPTGEGDLEAIAEPTGQHCPQLHAEAHTVTGGCVANAASTGSVVWRTHIFALETITATCTTAFTTRTNEDAVGYATNVVLGGPSCGRRPCREEPSLEQEPWFGIGHERTYMHGSAPSEQNWQEVVHVDFCVEPLTANHNEFRCEVLLPVRAVAGSPHKYEFGIAPTSTEEMPGIGPLGGRCELNGHWTTSGDSSGMEVIHSFL